MYLPGVVLVVEDDGEEQVFTWQASQITVENKEDGILQSTGTYLLDGKGRAKSYEEDGSTEFYEYNSGGYLVKSIDQYSPSSADTTIITWEDGNIVRVEGSSDIECEYDPDEPFDCSTEVLPIFGKSPKNLVKRKIYDGGQETYSYLRNGDGYVVKVTIDVTGFGVPFVSEFEYECQ